MAKEPAAAKRRDAAAHTSVEAERAGPSFGAGAARVPRPWHTSTAPAHHCHPKAPTVVTRLQTVGVGFRCLHHHSGFPVRLEVVSRRVSKRDSHTFISLPFIVAAHLRVEISHLYLLLRPSKGQGESGDISTGVRRWWCCHSPAGATEEEIKTFTNPVLVNFLRFPNTSQFQSISAAKKKSGKRKKNLIQSSSPPPPAHQLGELLGFAAAGALGLPSAAPSPQHPRSPGERSRRQRQTADSRGRQPWCDGAQGKQSSVAAFPPRPGATTLCQPSSDCCSRRGSLGAGAGTSGTGAAKRGRGSWK